MGMPPESTRMEPNHITATVERLKMAIIVGMVTANSRLTRIEVSKRSRLAASKRTSSCCVRTKARMTRTPARASRMTWLIRSSLACIARKSGMARRMTRKTTTNMRGRITTRRPDRGTSSRRAMITPPMPVIGARIMIVRAMKMTIWTCCTSFVLRVMSEAVPKWLISTWA